MSHASSGLTPEQLDVALAAVSSPDWRMRSEAVLELAGEAHDPRAFAELVKRLDDSDTAVIEAATEGLVKGGGKAGLQEVLRGLVNSEDDVGYHIRDRLVVIYLDGFPLVGYLHDVFNDASDDAIRAGALEIMKLLEAR